VKKAESSMSAKHATAATRRDGWKTVTGKIDRVDARSRNPLSRDPVSYASYGGLDEVPAPHVEKRLDRHEAYLKVGSARVAS
jgi:hypothetical protein